MEPEYPRVRSRSYILYWLDASCAQALLKTRFLGLRYCYLGPAGGHKTLDQIVGSKCSILHSFLPCGWFAGGGSENLWCGAAKQLLRRGFPVSTNTAFWAPIPQQIEDLLGSGANVKFDRPFPGVALRLLRYAAPAAYANALQNRTRRWLARIDSPNVIISCGSLRDDFSRLVHLAEQRTPYVVIVQAAAPEIWPTDENLSDISQLLEAARRVFFVSRHNQEDVRQCLGTELRNAEVVSNPVNIRGMDQVSNSVPECAQAGGLRLACVARLCVEAKGQDILLRTLALEKWRQRDVSLTFYGEGPQEQVLRNAAHYFKLSRVSFAGHVSDVANIWREHDLGVLASRYEGLPLALVEAMMLGRANVVTRVCGNPEVVDDNDTGFIAASATVEAFDEALERAWTRRNELRDMGLLAAKRIRELLPGDACAVFAERLLEIFSCP